MHPIYPVLAVALLLGLLLFFLRRSELSPRRPWIAHALELAILLVSMGVPLAWVGNDLTPELLLGNINPGPREHVESVLMRAAFFCIFSLPVLLLIRFVPSRLLVVTASIAWTVFPCAWIHAWKTQPVITEIRELDVAGLLKESVLVGFWTGCLRLVLWPVLAVLGGFYAVRHRFSYARLVMGVVLAGVVSGLLLTPFAIWPRWYLAPVCFAAFAAILVSLPRQRAGFERLLGIRLSHGVPAAPLPYSAAGAFAGHLSLLLLGVLVACSAVLNYFERVQYRTIMEGPPAAWHSPAEANAFTDMKLYFRKGEKYPKVTAAESPADWGRGLDLISQISSGTREQIWAELDVAEWKAYFASLREFTDAFERASRADYLQMPGAEVPSFLNLGETARTLAIASQIAMRENRPLDAVHDVRTIFRVGGLLRDNPNLVGQMAGVAMRGIATSAAWGLLAQAPENQELLEALAVALKEVAPESRVGVNYAALSVGQRGVMSGPIIPNVERVMPAFGRAHNNALVGWMNFDLVQIATALELHKIHAGGYPGEIQELAPAFLKRIPREPIEGREYSYKRTADGSYELRNLAYSGEWREKYAAALSFPAASAEDTTTTVSGKKAAP